MNTNYINSFRVQKFLSVSTKWLDPGNEMMVQNHIFRSSWQSGVVDINLLVYNRNASWSLITYFPYDNEDCSKFNYKTIVTYTTSNHTQLAIMPMNKLYARKMQNLQKCPINISIFPCKPYVHTIIENGQPKVDGIEIRILKTIASALNFKPIFIMPLHGREKFNFADTRETAYKMVHLMYFW